MFSSPILSIAITLFAAYLLLAIMATGINEIIFILFRQRRKQLEEFLANFIFDEEWKNVTFPDFSESPFISVLKKDKEHFPDDIPPANFARAILTIAGEGRSDLKTIKGLVKAKVEKGSIYPMLNSLSSQVGNTAELQAEIEKIFEAAMQRVTGIYRRNARIVSFFVGLALAVFLNIDTITITDRLWSEKELANRTADNATLIFSEIHKDASGTVGINRNAKAVTESVSGSLITRIPGNADDSLKQAIARLKTANALIQQSELPLGWATQNYPGCTDHFWTDLLAWVVKTLGFLLTAVAISLGAPFWFDILSRVTPLRKSSVSVSPPQSAEKQL